MDKHIATQVLERAKDLGASDVHIAVGSPILFRINGELLPQTKQVVTAAQSEGIIKEILGDAQLKRYREQREIDSSYQLKDGTRLRINCFFERGNMGRSTASAE